MLLDVSKGISWIASKPSPKAPFPHPTGCVRLSTSVLPTRATWSVNTHRWDQAPPSHHFFVAGQLWRFRGPPTTEYFLLWPPSGLRPIQFPACQPARKACRGGTLCCGKRSSCLTLASVFLRGLFSSGWRARGNEQNTCRVRGFYAAALQGGYKSLLELYFRGEQVSTL